jgi:hypothetical protein
MDYFGAGGGPGSQLSKERIFKIRQKAVKLLSKAFALDEVAASVATMQATSTVEDVGSHVLKREPQSTGESEYCKFEMSQNCGAHILKMQSTCTSFMRRSLRDRWNNARRWTH